MPGLSRDKSPFIKAEEIQRVKGEHAGIAADPNPETHRVVRKMVAPAFNRRALKEQEPAIHQHIDRLIEKVGDESKDGTDMTEVCTLPRAHLHLAKDMVMVLIGSSVV